jgi:(p)ppGpp synthase/HD superfamily hydrolase
MPNKPITVLEAKAWGLAEFLHRNQVRKNSGKSYFDEHVAKVNGTCKLYTTKEHILIAALLHDTIEDCFDDFVEGFNVIKNMFGETIAKMVVQLTTDKNILATLFSGDKGKYLAYKMKSMDNDTLTVKLADRLRNLDDAITAKNIKYVQQTLSIMEELNVSTKHNIINDKIAKDIIMKCNNTLSIYSLDNII